jgi:hypothetical protein
MASIKNTREEEPFGDRSSHGKGFGNKCLGDSDRIIHDRLSRSRNRQSRQTYRQSAPLHNPSHNPLILRRHSLKEKDNPATRGCGGRKCLPGFSTQSTNREGGHILEKNVSSIKKKSKWWKFRILSLDFVQSTSLPKVSFLFVPVPSSELRFNFEVLK